MVNNNELLNNIYTNISNAEKAAKEAITNLIKETFGDRYILATFGSSALSIGFYNGKTWNDGTPKKTSVDICYGPKLFEKETFEFNLFVSSYGGFDLKDNSTIAYRYYAMVADILSNESFKNSLYSILVDFSKKYNELRNESYSIESEIRKEQQRIADEEKAAKELAQIEEFKKTLTTATSETYALVIKTDSGKFSYRNKSISIIEISDNYGMLICNMKNLGRKTGSAYYRVVEASKIKF